MKLPSIIHGTAIDDQGIPVNLGYLNDQGVFGRSVQRKPQAFGSLLTEAFVKILTDAEVNEVIQGNDETVFNEIAECFYSHFDKISERKKQCITLRIAVYSLDASDPLNLITKLSREIHLSIQKWGDSPYLKVVSNEEFE